ncbi:MAG: DUF547 domain-containing protein [Flavobacteriaceae bacterium]|jgi:hypothetical protein|nr:DUF547 domain-containing protein [Candidatus Arcticimaribacter sp.]
MKTLLITLLISLGLTNSEINFQQDQNQDKGIHASWNVLLQQYVDADGNVDYRSWKKSQTDLDKYIQLLEKTPPANYWDKNDSLAYFINAYNAVTVKLILDNYPLKSIRDIKDPWDSKSLNLPNNRLTLNDIEHKVLRKMDDPRIHFAINCASASCPQLSNEAFRASKVQKQLEEATALFINDTSKNQISEKNIGLSKIFLWFSKDFGSKKERLAFIQKYSQKPFKDNAKIKYQEYDWSLNE